MYYTSTSASTPNPILPNVQVKLESNITDNTITVIVSKCFMEWLYYISEGLNSVKYISLLKTITTRLFGRTRDDLTHLLYKAS